MREDDVSLAPPLQPRLFIFSGLCVDCWSALCKKTKQNKGIPIPIHPPEPSTNRPCHSLLFSCLGEQDRKEKSSKSSKDKKRDKTSKSSSKKGSSSSASPNPTAAFPVAADKPPVPPPAAAKSAAMTEETARKKVS